LKKSRGEQQNITKARKKDAGKVWTFCHGLDNHRSKKVVNTVVSIIDRGKDERNRRVGWSLLEKDKLSRRYELWDEIGGMCGGGVGCGGRGEISVGSNCSLIKVSKVLLRSPLTTQPECSPI